jgi:hypothetical protein
MNPSTGTRTGSQTTIASSTDTVAVPIVVGGMVFDPSSSKGIYVRNSGSSTSSAPKPAHIDFQIILTAEEYAELERRRAVNRK